LDNGDCRLLPLPLLMMPGKSQLRLPESRAPSLSRVRSDLVRSSSRRSRTIRSFSFSFSNLVLLSLPLEALSLSLSLSFSFSFCWW
jgi:hypothetical protein